MVLSYTNSKSPLDRVPQHDVVTRTSDDVRALYLGFKQHLAQHAEQPRRFPDKDSLRCWFDSNQIEVFEYRVRNGLFIRMSDREVEAARRKMPPPLPGGSNAA